MKTRVTDVLFFKYSESKDDSVYLQILNNDLLHLTSVPRCPACVPVLFSWKQDATVFRSTRWHVIICTPQMISHLTFSSIFFSLLPPLPDLLLLFLIIFLSALLLQRQSVFPHLWNYVLDLQGQCCTLCVCVWFGQRQACMKNSTQHTYLHQSWRWHSLRPVSQYEWDCHYETLLPCVEIGLHVAWS